MFSGLQEKKNRQSSALPISYSKHNLNRWVTLLGVIFHANILIPVQAWFLLFQNLFGFGLLDLETFFKQLWFHKHNTNA